MNRVLLAAMAGALFAATPAFAADDGGFYVGASIGQFGVDESGFSESDTSFKLFGGWMYNQFIGGDLEYIDGGTVRDGDFGIDSTGINVSIKGNWPVTEQFDVFGKVGYYFWDADIDVTGNSGQESNESGSDVSWGIGAGWNFTENLGLIAEYQWFTVEEADSTLWSGGIVWKF
jgi:opacity protein-like surface antigen